MSTPVIETDGLSRSFGAMAALKHLTLAVPEGVVFALIGPNGAGKTTTIKMLMNLLEPSSGRATVLGRDSRRLGPAELRQIGYVSENQELPAWMTVRELFAYLRPLYPAWDETFADTFARRFDLPLAAKIASLSRGMRMKASLLSSLAYHPRLLVLDEPFSGLDPLVRDELVDGLLASGGQNGWTVFISSHDVDEVERLADWVGFLNAGRLELFEPVPSLLARFREVEVTVEEPAALPASLPGDWLLAEQAGRGVRFVETAFEERQLVERVKTAIGGVRDVSAAPMSLRSIFVTLARRYRQQASEVR